MGARGCAVEQWRKTLDLVSAPETVCQLRCRGAVQLNSGARPLRFIGFGREAGSGADTNRGQGAAQLNSGVTEGTGLEAAPYSRSHDSGVAASGSKSRDAPAFDSLG